MTTLTKPTHGPHQRSHLSMRLILPCPPTGQSSACVRHRRSSSNHSPDLWFVVALVVRLNDGGPAFFTQERVGLDGRTFYHV